jgi:hypothetical protein
LIITTPAVPTSVSKARSAVDNEDTEGKFAAENVVKFDICLVPIEV